MKELSPERLALLRKYGFSDRPDCDISWIFPAPAYAMDTHMSVRGDHSSDLAYVYYATSVEGEAGEMLDGLFYSPSLLEYLLYDFGNEIKLNRLVSDLRRQLDCDMRLVFVKGYPNFFIAIDEYDWREADIRFQISDMLKLIGQLDYLLPRKLENLRAKRRKK